MLPPLLQTDPVDSTTLSEFERCFSIVLPDDFAKLQSQYGGGTVPIDRYMDGTIPQTDWELTRLYRLNSQEMRDAGEFLYDIQHGYLPIGGDTGGNHYLLSLASGEVRLWELWRHSEVPYDHSDMTVVATELRGFLRMFAIPL